MREMYSVRTLSEAKSISPSKVRQAISKGELKAYRHGGNVTVRPEDADRWWESQLQPYERNERAATAA